MPEQSAQPDVVPRQSATNAVENIAASVVLANPGEAGDHCRAAPRWPRAATEIWESMIEWPPDRTRERSARHGSRVRRSNPLALYLATRLPRVLAEC